MVLLSAQGMDVAAIARVAFTSEDRVRNVIRNFNADGFGSLYPKYKGGHPPKFTLGQRREIKKIAKSKPARVRPAVFRTWSLAELAVSWWPRGWSTTSATKACGSCSAPRVSPFSTWKPGERLQGPALCGEDGAHRAAVRDRRPGSSPGGRRSGGDLLR